MPKPLLTQKDFEDAALQIGCEVAAIKAVAEVESRGDGFLSTGEPKILFERHIFSKRTGGIFDKTNPGISNRVPGGYGTVASQHKRLQEAVPLNRNAALMSASWGKFQIMGFNYTLAGYNSLQEFITAMYQGEREHLLAFINYIKNTFLDDELRDKRWTDFARKYNGPLYWKNKYDTKMAEAYKKFSGRSKTIGTRQSAGDRKSRGIRKAPQKEIPHYFQ
ncbi:N-acetylmuramidase family protein [Niabella insulamsoli]|uniref:N-acetylmuramidase family protein n=1 Tax=Niabella insulamsoli TaxID=3144874 RepID=UPI0031FD4BD7